MRAYYLQLISTTTEYSIGTFVFPPVLFWMLLIRQWITTFDYTGSWFIIILFLSSELRTALTESIENLFRSYGILLRRYKIHTSTGYLLLYSVYIWSILSGTLRPNPNHKRSNLRPNLFFSLSLMPIIIVPSSSCLGQINSEWRIVPGFKAC